MELVLPLMEPESQAKTPRENAFHDDGIVQDLRRQTPMSQGVTSRRREWNRRLTAQLPVLLTRRLRSAVPLAERPMHERDQRATARIGGDHQLVHLQQCRQANPI